MTNYNLRVTSVTPLSKNKPKKAIILCHGFGGDGKDISSLAIGWQRFLPDVIFLSPDALACSQASCVSLFERAFLALAIVIAFIFLTSDMIRSYLPSSGVTYEQNVFLLAYICANRSRLFKYFTLFIICLCFNAK